jgi:hypothetical protein
MTRGLRRVLEVAAVATLLPFRCALGAGDPNERWVEVRSAHFVVSSNAGDREARRIADQFEQIRALFSAAATIFPCSLRLSRHGIARPSRINLPNDSLRFANRVLRDFRLKRRALSIL